LIILGDIVWVSLENPEYGEALKEDFDEMF